MVSCLLNQLAERLTHSTDASVLRAYRAASFLPGRTVTVIDELGRSRVATVLDIDEKYRLVVRTTDGVIEALDSGEVSIRPLKETF
jgi:biotin-(acetyl-CoA carboxylase) ligase